MTCWYATARGYEPTPKGDRLQQELATMLPRLDRLLAGADFDPERERAAFRIAGTDNAFAAMSPPLCRQLLPWFGNVSLQMFAWHDGTFEDLERGRLDLTLNADDGHTPERLRRELLYEDEFVCVVLSEYVKALHIGIGILSGRQTIPEQRLSALGHQRSCSIEVTYFSTAFRSIVGTT
jgi:DNA-binding transcriptional LysR family regulator